MGWWKDAVESVTEAVSTVVENVGNAVGEVVGDLYETLGNGIGDGFNWLGNSIGGGFGGFVTRVGRLIAAQSEVVGVILKAAIEAPFGFVAGQIRILGGIISLNGPLIVKGFLGLLSSSASWIILGVSRLIGALQNGLYLQDLDRRLNERELSILRRVFRDSLDYYNLRIVEGRAGIFGVSSRPITLGNRIYLKGDLSEVTLVHEATHVWQYLHIGSKYVGDAILAQWTIPKQEEYDWDKEIAKGRTEWKDFNREAQAELVEDVYNKGSLVAGTGTPLVGRGVFYDADGVATFGHFEFNKVDYTPLADRAVARIRGAKLIRLLALFR